MSSRPSEMLRFAQNDVSLSRFRGRPYAWCLVRFQMAGSWFVVTRFIGSVGSPDHMNAVTTNPSNETWRGTSKGLACRWRAFRVCHQGVRLATHWEDSLGANVANARRLRSDGRGGFATIRENGYYQIVLGKISDCDGQQRPCTLLGRGAMIRRRFGAPASERPSSKLRFVDLASRRKQSSAEPAFPSRSLATRNHSGDRGPCRDR
jgi:hypothetical protein